MKYIIEEDTYYTSNGCSCCEQDEFKYYKIRKEGGSYVGCDTFDGDFLCYTYNSTQEALEKILSMHDIDVEYEHVF